MTDMNVFVKSPVIPDRFIALVVKSPEGLETIWYGLVVDIPEADFNRADEAHVSEWTYERIAARAEATGKGTTLQ